MLSLCHFDPELAGLVGCWLWLFLSLKKTQKNPIRALKDPVEGSGGHPVKAPEDTCRGSGGHWNQVGLRKPGCTRVMTWLVTADFAFGEL